MNKSWRYLPSNREIASDSVVWALHYARRDALSAARDRQDWTPVRTLRARRGAEVVRGNKFRRRVDLGGNSFGFVSSYGSREVFLHLGWDGETKAMVATTPGRALGYAKAIIAAVEKERTRRRRP